jgi:hypothetical protein
MNKISPIFVALGVIGLAIVVLVGGYISGNNTAARYEANINASYKDSQNVLGQLAPKLRESVSITKVQEAALRNIITGANTSRYGPNGTAAAVQVIQESNPTLDQSSYARIVAMIEATRNDFATKQRRTADEMRGYKTALTTLPGSMFIKMAGYPTAGFIEKYDVVVQSSHSDNAFKTGIDDGVDINSF